MASTASPTISDGPAIILVGAQLGQNIGKAVRAMYNFGLTDLRLVAPRDGWPNEAAYPAAAGADFILDRAQVFETTAEAIADLQFTYATTVRKRGMIKSVITPRKCAKLMRRAVGKKQKVGLLFGPERAGLVNEDIALSDAIVTIPLNPDFSSINLAQAVILLSYEWHQAGDETPEEYTELLDTTPASGEDIQRLFDHMETELMEAGYFRHEKRRTVMQRNIRNIFKRSNLTKEEVTTMRGVIKALATGGGVGWKAEKKSLKK
jgi:tRNA/rRNA methyltransferase